MKKAKEDPLTLEGEEKEKPDLKFGHSHIFAHC